MHERNQDEDMRIREEKIKAAVDMENQRHVGDASAPYPAPADLCGQAVTTPRPFVTGESKLRAYSRADVLEKEGFEHIAEAQKRQAAASFLRSHPEFERFMDLIRTGALILY